MSGSVYEISFVRLLWVCLPVLAVGVIYHRWSIGTAGLLHGFLRMFLQLLLIGYLLSSIFATDSPTVVLMVLTVMLGAASLIALRPVRKKRRSLYLNVFLSILGGGTLTLAAVVKGVISLDPWYEPRYVIPLAGMIFANAMNAVSIGAERFEAEFEREPDFPAARATALKASLIPITNSLFAVGIVSLPGMMTGQILSGISPLIAVRYQIMVMCMVFGASGISSAIYLSLLARVIHEPS